MTDDPSLRRRTVLQGSALAALGYVPRTGLAEEGRTLEYYANEDGVVDVDGVGDAAFDFREGVIDDPLLRDVIDHWQSGDPVGGDGSANPARLIDSHVSTLSDTSFELDVREFDGGPETEPTKEAVFEWDHERKRSRLAETSAETRDVGLSQLFTDDRQHVDVDFADDERNQASLDIDAGPVYIDGSDLLDRLLIGASLSVTGQVPVGDRTLPRYEIESHRRLDDVEGHVVGDEEAYVAELELRWTTADGNRVGIELLTDAERAGGVTTHGSFEAALGTTDTDGSTDVATGHDAFVTIRDLSPSDADPLEYGSRETFEFTIDYDIGDEPPGYFSVSVREEEWGSIGEYVEIDDASGSVDVSYTRNIGDDWDQARLIANLYPEEDGCPGIGCVNSVVASDEVVYETTDDAGGGGGGSGPRPDLEVHDVAWSPADPEPDETVEFSVEVENTGDVSAETIETRVFVDGELAHVPPTIDLDPGERRWTVETGNQSFGPGDHTVRAVIDPDDKIPEQSRDENELERTLTVDGDAATVDARVQWIDVADGTYETAEAVTTTVGVENTGNVEHTFFVGYTVHGPAGGSYDNDGGTGRSITLGPGESRWVDLDWIVESDAPDGSYDVEVAVWEEADRDSLHTRLDGVEESGGFTVESTEERDEGVSIGSIEADDGAYRSGEPASITTAVQNDDAEQYALAITHTLTDPNGTERRQTVTRTVGGNDAITVTPRWDVDDAYPVGTYDITVDIALESDPETTIVERTRRHVFEVTESDSPVDLRIETVSAQGDPLDGVIVTLQDPDTGASRSATSDDGVVTFRDVDRRRYGLVADANQLHQELQREVVVDGTGPHVRRLRFDPAEPVRGLVLDNDGDQFIPDATVSVPELELTTRTDDTGAFEFGVDVPDGTYEFQIRVDEGGTVTTAERTTVTETREIGLNRSVTFAVPVETAEPGDDDELLSEENLFVSLVIRNLERWDVPLPVQVPVIQKYGTAKGATAALLDFVEGIRDLLTLDLAEFVEGIKELVMMIVEDVTVLKRLGAMLIEGFREKQRADNPFEHGSVNYRVFQGSWFTAYTAVTVVLGILGGKGTRQVADIATDATELRRGISDFRSRFGRSDDVTDGSVLASRVDASDAAGDVGAIGTMGLTQSATYPSVVQSILIDIAAVQRKAGDRAPRLFDDDVRSRESWADVPGDHGHGTKANVIGEAGEIEMGSRLLSDVDLPGDDWSLAGLFARRDGDDSDWDAETGLTAKSVGIVKGAKGTPGGHEMEFDHLVVRKNADGQVEIDEVWEVTVSAGSRRDRESRADDKRSQAAGHVDTITELLDSGAIDPGDTIGGVPYRAFRNVDESDIKAAGPRDGVDFDTTLFADGTEYRSSVEHVFNHRDAYDDFLTPQ